MDPRGHIYMDDEDKIPAEDKARLDGFLRGRSEADALAIARKQRRIAAIEARLAESRRSDG